MLTTLRPLLVRVLEFSLRLLCRVVLLCRGQLRRRGGIQQFLGQQGLLDHLAPLLVALAAGILLLAF